MAATNWVWADYYNIIVAMSVEKVNFHSPRGKSYQAKLA